MENLKYQHHPGLKAHPDNIPKHVAIIMDGNGRWAKAQNLSRTRGHQKGVESVREIISVAQEKKIQVLTLFAFGMENWKRPAKEVRNLFRLFLLVLHKDIARLHENNIRLKIIGNRAVFQRALLTAIEKAEKLTANNNALTLNIAVNYSGRWDIMQAIERCVAPFSEAQLEKELSLHGLPEPDLFIRTGGVLRLSNFILWEMAYTELYFTDTLWPEFKAEEMEKALKEYATRERRFGLTGEQLG